MAKSDTPTIMSSELPQTIGETLDGVQLDLLPPAIQQDSLARWIFSDPLRVWNADSRAGHNDAIWPHLAIALDIEHVAIQLIECLTPYYQAILSGIGQAWNDAERMIADLTSATEDEHLGASLQLTQQRLEAQDELSPAAQTILTLVRDSPDLFIEALHAELTDRCEAQAALLNRVQSCWRLWRQDVVRFQNSVMQLRLAIYAMDKQVMRGAALELARTEVGRVAEQLASPTALSKSLHGVGLDAPVYPAKRVMAAVTDARHKWDKAIAVELATHTAMQSASPSALGFSVVEDRADASVILLRVWDTEEHRGSVTKRELSRRVADKVGSSVNEAERLITQLLYSISEALTEGNSVRLPGIGKFAVREAPRTPHPVAFSATTFVAPAVEFTPSKELAESIEASAQASPDA